MYYTRFIKGYATTNSSSRISTTTVPIIFNFFLFHFLIFFNFWTNEVTTILKFSQNIFQVYSNILESKIKQREIGQAGNVILGQVCWIY